MLGTDILENVELGLNLVFSKIWGHSLQLGVGWVSVGFGFKRLLVIELEIGWMGLWVDFFT